MEQTIGNEGKGQFIEHCLCAEDILEIGLIYDVDGNYQTDTFFDRLNDSGKQYLHDNDGSEGFSACAKDFLDDARFHLFGCTNDTMAKLVLFAECNEEQREDLLKSLKG